jgi:4a-hydroxytetrahydrobiopterin dehydratase
MELIESTALADALTRLDGWQGDTTGISRTVSLATFPAAIAAVDQIALAAEEIDHHPDIDIRWRTLTLRVTTWEADSHVTDLDLNLAARIDKILKAATGREVSTG